QVEPTACASTAVWMGCILDVVVQAWCGLHVCLLKFVAVDAFEGEERVEVMRAALAQLEILGLHSEGSFEVCCRTFFGPDLVHHDNTLLVQTSEGRLFKKPADMFFTSWHQEALTNRDAIVRLRNRKKICPAGPDALRAGNLPTFTWKQKRHDAKVLDTEKNLAANLDFIHGGRAHTCGRIPDIDHILDFCASPPKKECMGIQRLGTDKAGLQLAAGLEPAAHSVFRAGWKQIEPIACASTAVWMGGILDVVVQASCGLHLCLLKFVAVDAFEGEERVEVMRAALAQLEILGLHSEGSFEAMFAAIVIISTTTTIIIIISGDARNLNGSPCL
ncbi:unnamed protein product, partial [Symbiodinium necroappetens]